jgi:mono/diheme cytochrome c family protein
MRSGNRLHLVGLVLLVALAAVMLGTVPASAQTPDPTQLEQGARLFADNCAVCHGSQGQGRVGATLAKNWPSIRPDLLVKDTIARGIAGSPMPAWGQQYGGPLSSAEIDALVAYILSWETGGVPPIPPTSTANPRPALTPIPNVQGDPNQGAILFDQNCAVCHGPNGEGRVGVNLAKTWPSIRPDISIKNIIANGVSDSPMPAWSQANGGPLSETNIDDLTAFVLTLPARYPQPAPPTPTPTPALSPFFSGWGGIVFGLVLFIVIVGIAIWIQARRA